MNVIVNQQNDGKNIDFFHQKKLDNYVMKMEKFIQKTFIIMDSVVAKHIIMNHVYILNLIDIVIKDGVM